MPLLGPENEIIEQAIMVSRARLMRRTETAPRNFTRDVLPRQALGFIGCISFLREINFLYATTGAKKEPACFCRRIS
jgi:hypothetical protein